MCPDTLVYCETTSINISSIGCFDIIMKILSGRILKHINVEKCGWFPKL